MKIVILLILVHFNVNASENTLSTSIDNSLSQSSDSKLSLEFLVATEQTKNIVNKNLDGTFSKFDASLLHSLNENHEVRYFLSSRYLTNDLERSEFDWYFTEFMYRRKNIFQENSAKLDVEFEFKNLYYLDNEIRDMYGYNGTTIPQIILKRRFGRYSSIELKLRRHFNHTNNNSSYTVNHEDRVYLGFSQMLSRRFLAYTQFKYQNKSRKDEGLDYRFMELATVKRTKRGFIPDFSKVPSAKKNQELVTFHPSIMYFLTRKSMLEVYYETKLSNTYDKRSLNKIMNDEAVFGAALYLTAF